MSALEDQIKSDLKTAMLNGESNRVETLRTLRSAIQYAQVAGENETLSDEEIINVLQKESKKRTEAAELYEKNNDIKRATNEKNEKEIIEKYLPKKLEESELVKIIDEEIAKTGGPDKQNMGKIIGSVKARAKGAADGSTIARIVQEKI
jgi:uncharacterized protein YqeY